MAVPLRLGWGEDLADRRRLLGAAVGGEMTPISLSPLCFFSLSGSTWALWKSRPPRPSWSQSEYLLWGLEIGPRVGAGDGVILGAPGAGLRATVVDPCPGHRHSLSASPVPGPCQAGATVRS